MRSRLCPYLFTTLVTTILCLKEPDTTVRLKPGEVSDGKTLSKSVLTSLRSGISFPGNVGDSTQASCTTPKDKNGKCKNISDCPKVLDNLANEYPAICKWIGLTPVVCCPEETPDPNTSENVPDLHLQGCGLRKILKISTPLVARQLQPFRRKLSTSILDPEEIRDEVAVVGGHEVERYSWPWMVGISRKSTFSERFLCGGALISPNYVISAAHCFKISDEPVSPSVYTFRVGGHTLKDGTKYDVEDVIVRECYKPSQNYHDIAVLKVKGSASFNNKVTPVCLPKPSLVREDFIGRRATITGWGDTSFGKLAVNRPISTYLKRDIMFPGNDGESNDNLCTTHKNEKGKCRDISDCLEALDDVNKEHPTVCEWNGANPVICCPMIVPPDSTPDPSVSRKIPNLFFPGCGIRAKHHKRESLMSERLQSSKADHASNEKQARPIQTDSSEVKFVVGGFEASPNSWKWMVGISQKFELYERFLCGGSLISASYVISAAHCFKISDKPISPSVYTVRVGAHTLNDGTKYSVDDVNVHELYQSNKNYHDIAILKVKGEVSLNNKVMPVCLPQPSFVDEDFNGRKVTITGWGDTSFGGPSSKVLQEVSIPVVSNKNCNSSYSKVASSKYPQGITRGQICAGLSQGGKDACQVLLPFP
ncbi:transmembrane protease serine 9-like isoform X2 [Tachypleus tridentatus]|uniref:transmembrane protease serine 9-like isoform X2 n=1 Tax=Tachypleus tridentatus TaxID=6853 RepID=UPI003FD185CA